MNKKLLGLAVVLMVIALLATPLVNAKPASEKNNEKFEYFKLEFNGNEASESAERQWYSPPNGDPPNVDHSRGTTWDDTSVTMVELTVGGETFYEDSSPYSVDYTTTFDGDGWLNDLGMRVAWHMRLTDVIPVYYFDGTETTEIGTLVLIIRAAVDATDYPAIKLSGGAVTGYGTGALKGVHISAVDLGFWFDPYLLFGREGTITGWPEEITNLAPPP